MTDEQINIRIAEACGWFFMYDSWHYPNGAEAITIPDYLNDLNAMHEAEKILKDDQNLDYSEHLENTTVISMGTNYHCYLQRLISATARQRAEAFLRTLGKWEEEA